MPTESPQSSQSCTTRDLIPSSPVIRCEKSSTDELLKAVNAIKGAIGYAETAVTADDETSKYPNLGEVQVDGPPASGSLLAAFLSYMSTDTASSVLQSYGDIPCGFTSLCH